jgi:hypothetical protein
VLPTPHAVLGLPEPPWPLEPPRAAPMEAPATAPRRAPGRVPARAPIAAPPARPRTTPRPGESVECEVLPEKTRKGGWRFRVLADGKTGVLHPKSASPGDLAPGARVRLIVRSAGQEYMLEWPGQPPAAARDSSS